MVAYQLDYKGLFGCKLVQYVTGGCAAAVLLIVVVAVACYKRRKHLMEGSKQRAIKSKYPGYSIESTQIPSVYPGYPVGSVCTPKVKKYCFLKVSTKIVSLLFLCKSRRKRRNKDSLATGGLAESPDITVTHTRNPSDQLQQRTQTHTQINHCLHPQVRSVLLEWDKQFLITEYGCSQFLQKA